MIVIHNIMVRWQLLLRLMISHEVRVVRLLFVVDNHGLNIGQHVLALPETSIFHLALLDALHAPILFLSTVVGAAAILLIATATSTVEILLDERFHSLLTHILISDIDGVPLS